MIGLECKELKTERLSLRLLKECDKAPLFEILKDDGVTAPAGFHPAKTPEEFDTFFEHLTMYNTAVGVFFKDALIGYVHVNKYTSKSPLYEKKRCISLGFIIGKDYQNKGFGTEALEGVTDYLKSIFDFCFADCFKKNAASRRIIEKCGYKYFETYTMFFRALNEEKTCDSFAK